MKHKRHILLIAVLLATAIAVAFIPSDSAAESHEPVATDQLLLVVEPAGTNSEMLAYEGFYVAFNADAHQPNYVAWQLTYEHANAEVTTRSTANFAADPRVAGCATLDDYRNSGFDRGHMAPAADMKWSEQAMDDCHLLTNICPQDRKVNGGPWATVEKNARKWTATHGTLYIVAGPILTDHITRYIGETHVPVPERFFKVIIAPDANPPMGIAFLMPNHPFQGGAQAAVTSIDNIEAITGYDFFSALPDDIEADVEAQHSMARWQHPKR